MSKEEEKKVVDLNEEDVKEVKRRRKVLSSIFRRYLRILSFPELSMLARLLWTQHCIQ